jgi:hypothetical protein
MRGNGTNGWESIVYLFSRLAHLKYFPTLYLDEHALSSPSDKQGHRKSRDALTQKTNKKSQKTSRTRRNDPPQ